MKNKNTFAESLATNMLTYNGYVTRILELAVTRFKWINLPIEIDERYLELGLIQRGSMSFFKDSDLNNYLIMAYLSTSIPDIYNNPTKIQAFANNGYIKNLTNKDSCIIYNNYTRTPNISIIQLYAKRLYDLDCTIEVNARAQKTPVLIKSTEGQRLTLKNIYKEYDGNAPVIYGSKDLDVQGLTVLRTDAPYNADKLYQLKINLWNEVLTYLGIDNITVNKKERLISDEVNRSLGGTIANRGSHLLARQNAKDKINKMFGLNIDVVPMSEYLIKTDTSDNDSEDNDEMGVVDNE